MNKAEGSILTATIIGKKCRGHKIGYIGTVDGTKEEEIFLAFRHSRAVTAPEEGQSEPNIDMKEYAKYPLKKGDEVVFLPNTNPENGAGHALRWASKEAWNNLLPAGTKAKKPKKVAKKKTAATKPGTIAKVAKKVVEKVAAAVGVPVSPKPKKDLVLVRKIRVAFDLKDPSMFRFSKIGQPGQIDFGKLRKLSEPERMAAKGTLADDILVERQEKQGAPWVPCENNPLKDAPATVSKKTEQSEPSEPAVATAA